MGTLLQDDALLVDEAAGGRIGADGVPRVLLVEDDGDLATPLSEYLALERFGVKAVGSAREMRETFDTFGPDVLILDQILPDDSGRNALAWLRARSDLPIIMISSQSDLIDRILCLELGADDYLVKPFEFRELAARLRSVLRRVNGRRPAAPEVPKSVRFGEWTLDFASQQLRDDKQQRVHLTQAEFAFLSLLARHPNQVISRDQLMSCLGGRDWDPLDRSVDIRIAKLRGKLDRDPRLPSLIRTVRGAGYMLIPEQGDPRIESAAPRRFTDAS